MSSIPSGTMAELRAYADTTITAFDIVEGGKSGRFYFTSGDLASDDGAMTIIQAASTRKFKRPFEGFVRPEWFGVTETTTSADETTNMQKSVDFLKTKGGGILKLGMKLYGCNLKWKGNDNISVQGVDPTHSALWSPTVNKFAVEIDQEFLGLGTFFRDLTFSGTGPTEQLRHGIYVNCATGIYFDNVRISACGVGLFVNSTIDGHFNRCIFDNNYLAVFFTTVSGTNATITDINGQSLTVSDAYFVSQPCEQNFHGCTLNNNAIHMVIDDPSNTYDGSINVKFFGGLMQASSVGIYAKSPVGLLDQPMIIDGVWVENILPGSTPKLFNGDTLPVNDLYLNGGTAKIKGMFVGKMHAGNDSVIDLDGCTFYDGSSALTSTGTGSFTGRDIKGMNTFLPYYFETGFNAQTTQMLGFYTTPKTNLSVALRDRKIFSNTLDTGSKSIGNFGASVTKVPGGVMGLECVNVAADNQYGITSDPLNLVVNKIYVSSFNIRSLSGSFSLLHASTAGSHRFGNTSFLVTPEWKSIVMIGRAESTGSDDVYIGNYTGSSKVWQISGWQILEFDNVSELYKFLQSQDFVVDKDAPVDLTNTSTTAPNKSSLNSSYGTELAHSTVTYPNLGGGTIEYMKLTNSSTSDWVETIWSTGMKSIVP